jgi:hypothetical protein
MLLADCHFASDHLLKEVMHMWFAVSTEVLSLKTHESLCNAGPSVLKGRGSMLKYDAHDGYELLYSF